MTTLGQTQDPWGSISQLSKACLEELESLAGNRRAWTECLTLLPPQTQQGKAGGKLINEHFGSKKLLKRHMN